MQDEYDLANTLIAAQLRIVELEETIRRLERELAELREEMKRHGL